MISTTGIIPEELMYPEKKKEVIAFLQAQAFPGQFKRRLLEGWQITVGIRLRARDFNTVEASGVDGVNYGRNF
jgi:hypothetical protein